MSNGSKHNSRAVSDGSFFRNTKLGRLISSSSKKNKSNSQRNAKKRSRKDESVDALIRPSLSLRNPGDDNNKIATRRVSKEYNTNNPDNLGSPYGKRTSQFDLPDIVSIKSAKTRRTHSTHESDSEHDLDFLFQPRRSLHNSTAGIKKINTGHGFFNIPITIDSHNDKMSEDLLRSRKTETSLQEQSTNKSNSEIIKSEFNNTQNNNNINDETSSNGIFGTILSFAHSAVNHVPRISIEQPQNNNDTNNDNHDGNNSNKQNQSRIEKDNGSNSKEDSRINDTLVNETVIHNPTNNTTSKIIRSTSFLRHLDYLLSASNQNSSNDNNKNQNSNERIDSVTSIGMNSKFLSPISNNKNMSNISPASTESKISQNTNDELSNAPQSHQDIVNKVKFEPLKDSVPAISSLGKGNLTLDAFMYPQNVEDEPNMDSQLVNNGIIMDSDDILANHTDEIDKNVKFNSSVVSVDTSASNSAPILPRELNNSNEASNVRNSSYISLTKQKSLEELLKSSRARSKTLPANEVNIENNTSKTNEDKRNSRYSSVSNDEVMNTTSNQRKSRTMSRHFLSRRSFSPNINMRVPLPSVSLRNSINKNIISADFSDQQRPRTSTNLSDSLTPVLGLSYGKKKELQGIEYAIEKKNTEFHNLFKDAGLSSNEKLIVDHSCALSRDILIQGRMYITDQHLFFYSNILGWVTTVVILFNEIVQIEKKTTAGIFPNGIVIDTLHTKYIFASFISRDATFDLITDVWNQIILGKRHLRSNDDDFDFDSDILSAYSTNDDSSQGSDFYDDENDSDLNDTDMTSSDDLDDDVFGDISATKLSKQVTSSKFGPVKHVATTSNYTPAANERIVSETIIKGPLGKVATIMFGDDVSLLERILKAQKNFNLSPIPTLLDSKTREYTYLKPLNAGFGPSKTKCFITDKVLHYDFNDYVQVIQLSKTPDVPSGNAFVVKINTILTWDNANTTKITVYFSTDWSAKSWLKGAIDKGAYDGVAETTRVMNQEVEKMIKENILNTVPDQKESENENEKNIEILTLPTAGPATHAPTEPEYKKEKNDVIVEQNMNIPAPLGTVFELLYGNDTSYFSSILEKQNNFNISEVPKFINNEREFTYIKRLNSSIGPKQTKCLVNEKIEHKDFNHYTLTRQTVRSPDVPYGNSFSVQSRIFLSWGPSNTTNMLVVSNVVWTGKSLLKGTIERSSIDGQRNGSKTIISELKSIIANAGSTKKKSRKRSKSMKTTSEVKTINKPSEVIESEEEYGNITSTLVSAVENIDLFSISGIITIVLAFILLISLVTYWFRSDAQPKVVLVKPGRIMIDGNEYNYVPNIKTLYEVYEDDIVHTKKNHLKGSDFSNNIIKKSEGSIWEWLEDHNDILKKYNQHRDSNNSTVRDIINANKQKKSHFKTKPDTQKLMESIKITELQLQRMKEMLEKAETSS